MPSNPHYDMDRAGRPERSDGKVLPTLIQRVLDHVAAGQTDAWIIAKLGLGSDEYWDMKRRVFRSQVDAFQRRTTEEIYAEYVTQQAACIHDLSSVVEAARAKKPPDLKAQIATIKLRSDIYDRIIRTGQDFGIIERKAERREIAMGVVLADLSDEDLRARISGELTGLQDLMGKFGDKNLLELRPGRLHRKLSGFARKATDGKKSKTNRARANRVHGGRRVIKK